MRREGQWRGEWLERQGGGGGRGSARQVKLPLTSFL